MKAVKIVLRLMASTWAPWVWGTTKSALYKYIYLYLYLLLLLENFRYMIKTVGDRFGAVIPNYGHADTQIALSYSNSRQMTPSYLRHRSYTRWFSLTARLALWAYMTWSEWTVDGATSVCSARRCSADLLQTEVRAHNATAGGTALVICTWAHSVQTCGARFPLSPWYCVQIMNDVCQQ